MVADLNGRQATSTQPTLQEVITGGVEQLTAAGVASPRYDAEELAAHSVGCQRSELWRHLVNPAPAGLDEHVDSASCARAAAAHHWSGLFPLQHCVGGTGCIHPSTRDRGRR